jgi:hypothetical protein
MWMIGAKLDNDSSPSDNDANGIGRSLLDQREWVARRQGAGRIAVIRPVDEPPRVKCLL